MRFRFLRRPRQAIIAVSMGTLVLLSIGLSLYFSSHASEARAAPNVHKEQSRRQEYKAHQRDSKPRDHHLLLATSCDIPNMDMYDPSITPYITPSTKPNCRGTPSVTYIQDDRVYLDKSAIRRPPFNGNIQHCTFKPIFRPKFRASEHYFIQYLPTSEPFDTSAKVYHDFIRVSCFDKSNTTIYTRFHPVILSNSTKDAVQNARFRSHTETYDANNRLNIILVGVSSVSRQNFHRQMSAVYSTLKQHLSVVEMKGYSIVGQNKFLNMVPLLTGLRPKFLKTGSPFDDINNQTVWYKYEEAGYRTFYGEDNPEKGIFDYYKMGFEIPPTEYFNRPLFVAMHKEPDLWSSGTFCSQGRPQAEFVLNHTRDFLMTYRDKPTFSFSFISGDTEGDPNDAGRVDSLCANFLESLHSNSLLDKSLVVFFSDHGSQHGSIRETDIGAMEWRLPAMFLAFPPWFRTRHPRIWRNLEINQRRLTSAYDVYTTLGELLYLNEKGIPPPGDVPSGPGHSWLEEVPADRTCSDAGIPHELCPCHQWKKLENPPPDLSYIGKQLVRHLNEETLHSEHGRCHTLFLDKVGRGAVNKVSDSVSEYMVAFKVNNNAIHLEGNVRHNASSNAITVTGAFVRTNAYGNETVCVKDIDVRPFCVCR